MQIFAGVCWRGASIESGVVENGDFRFIRSLSSEHFTYMATRPLSGDTTVYIKVIGLFHIKFLKNGV